MLIFMTPEIVFLHPLLLSYQQSLYPLISPFAEHSNAVFLFFFFLTRIFRTVPLFLQTCFQKNLMQNAGGKNQNRVSNCLPLQQHHILEELFIFAWTCKKKESASCSNLLHLCSIQEAIHFRLSAIKEIRLHPKWTMTCSEEHPQ